MRKLVLGLLTAFMTLSAAAQSADMKPWELNMDRIKIAKFGGNLGSSNTVLIPTTNLLVTCNGSVWAKKGGAQAHGKFFVQGLDKELMQELSSKIQADLVTKLKAAGKTVLTYEDVKDDPVITGLPRLKVDEKWGLPLRGGWGQPLTYLIGTPSDAQAFDPPIQGPVWAMRSIAKDKNLIVLVPQYEFSVPQMFGETETTYTRDKAGVATDPAMVLEQAMINALDVKGPVAIQVQRHGKRFAAEVTGTIVKSRQDTFAGAWTRTSADYDMTIDKTALTDGVLRVAYAINTMVANEFVKAKKK